MEIERPKNISQRSALEIASLTRTNTALALSILGAAYPLQTEHPSVPTLTIRGHHLKHIEAFILGGSNPDSTAKAMHDFIKTYHVRRPERAAYVYDVLGLDKSSTTFPDGLKVFFKSFADFPAEGTLIIGSEKDGICRSCVHGTHCNNQPKLVDSTYAAATYFLAKELGLLEGVAVNKFLLKAYGLVEVSIPRVTLSAILAFLRLTRKINIGRYVELYEEYYGDLLNPHAWYHRMKKDIQVDLGLA